MFTCRASVKVSTLTTSLIYYVKENVVRNKYICEILGCHDDEYKDGCLAGGCTV